MPKSVAGPFVNDMPADHGAGRGAFPELDPDGRPRPATAAIRKLDGGVIGT